MQRGKPIKLRKGKVAELAKICGVCEKTVYSALRWENDTEMQNLIRKRAYDLQFVKQFTRGTYKNGRRNKDIQQ